MTTVTISGFQDLITFAILERISFSSAPNVIAQSDKVVTIRIVANIPIDHPLGMTKYREGFVLITIPLALWNKVKTMTSLDRLNVFLCNELEKQERTAQRQEEVAQKQAAAAQKKKETRCKKAELQKKRCQEKQDARNALKKKREEKRKARLQEKEKFKKKAPTIKTKYVLIKCDLRFQCYILLERIKLIKVNYKDYDFSGKRPRTCLSMLIFNLKKALETGQPLQRFINSTSRRLDELCPRRRVVSAQ
jgi:hypothetical protein